MRRDLSSVRQSDAIAEFCTWLPGELNYSAQKASYTAKLGRAHLDPSDNQSIHGFLGNEWFQANRQMELDIHNAETHQITAQLQFAKFAAGLFDKMSMMLWLQSHKVKTSAGLSIDEAVHHTHETLLNEAPWRTKGLFSVENPAQLLGQQFSDTPFSEGIVQIQKDITTIESVKENKFEIFTNASKHAARLGGLATQVYCAYADQYLNADEGELWLPPSKLEPKT